MYCKMIPTPVLVSQMVSLLFICGTLGNLYLAFNILRYFWRTRGQVHITNTNDIGHILMYIFAKCVAEGVMLTCAPFVVHFILTGYWSHGSALCLLYWLVEQTCAKASSLLFACVVFDRYAWLMNRSRFARLFNARSAIFVCLIVGVSSIAIVCPILPRVGAFNIIHAENNNTTVGDACVFDIHEIEDVVGGYLVVWLIFTFVIPVAIIVYCLCKILAYVYVNVQEAIDHLGEERHRCERMNAACLGGALALYLLCAIPHWTMSLLASLSPLFTVPQMNEAFLMFVLHLLPYLNAGGAWMFSALISQNVIAYIWRLDREGAGEEVYQMAALESTRQEVQVGSDDGNDGDRSGLSERSGARPVEIPI